MDSLVYSLNACGNGIDISVTVIPVEDAGVLVNFPGGPYSSKLQTQRLPNMICCGDEFFEVYIKLSSFSLQDVQFPRERGSHKTACGPVRIRAVRF